MINWIPDRNRFHLPKPPDWFLRLLWDQDAGLVLLPSRMQRKYVLARRRSASAALSTVVDTTVGRKLRRETPAAAFSDGDMLSEHQLVLVDSIRSRTGQDLAAGGSWMRSAPFILSELRRRDLWAAGGSEAYSDRLESQEQQAEASQRQTLLDDIDQRARDAWRSYQARTGQRTRVGDGPSRRSRATVVHVGTL